MYSHYRTNSGFGSWVPLALLLGPGAIACAVSPSEVAGDEPRVDRAKAPRVLRICADPNNLPFTNDRLEGFENQVAEVIARELGAEIQYSWRAQRRGFFRTSLKEREADLVLGVPMGFDMALVTDPYYRSTYVFVSRRDRELGVTSLDDPELKHLTIGVQLVGDDGTNPPPAHALARRGIIDNVVGYSVYGDYTEENPPARVVDAVVNGDLDIAIVWGPLAGYVAKCERVALDIVPVEPSIDPPALAFTFPIAMGVQRGDEKLQREINDVLKRCQTEIDAILADYGVPTLPLHVEPNQSGDQ